MDGYTTVVNVTNKSIGPFSLLSLVIANLLLSTSVNEVFILYGSSTFTGEYFFNPFNAVTAIWRRDANCTFLFF